MEQAREWVEVWVEAAEIVRAPAQGVIVFVRIAGKERLINREDPAMK